MFQISFTKPIFTATRLQRLHASNIKPLEQLRADLVFKLTELELQMMPFRRKLNISLSHIHTAQFYIDNQGDVIAHKVSSSYITFDIIIGYGSIRFAINNKKLEMHMVQYFLQFYTFVTS